MVPLSKMSQGGLSTLLEIRNKLGVLWTYQINAPRYDMVPGYLQLQPSVDSENSALFTDTKDFTLNDKLSILMLLYVPLL